jgi:hypothetical protein
MIQANASCLTRCSWPSREFADHLRHFSVQGYHCIALNAGIYSAFGSVFHMGCVSSSRFSKALARSLGTPEATAALSRARGNAGLASFMLRMNEAYLAN